jgi:protein-tyrosine phosphatase
MSVAVTGQGPRLAGTDNFRSLNGLPTRDGRRIAGHALLRSDQLHRLGEPDWAVLRALGVRTVCDLRTEAERRKYPNRLPAAGIEQVAIELISDVRVDPALTAPLRARPDAEGAAGMMMEIYRRLPASLAPHLGTLIGLLDEGRAPVLVHCVAGKDRTGFAVAVMLHALGVEEDSILGDYLLSRRSGDGERGVGHAQRCEMMAKLVARITGAPAAEAAVDAILDVRPAYLQAAFAEIDARYGSITAYLETCAGLDATALAELRDRWLEPA